MTTGLQSATQLQGPLSSLLQQLEMLACTEGSTAIPISLQPAVQHTLECIRRPYQHHPDPSSDPYLTPHPALATHHHATGSSSSVIINTEQEPVSLDEAWQCLAELLCEEDSWAVSVGQSWLYILLTEAAEQHMTHPEHQLRQEDMQSHAQSQQGYGSSDYDYPASPLASVQGATRQVGLLPHPLGGPPKPDAPAHLSNQLELSQLLSAVLSYSTDTVTTGLRFMQVVKRLVLHLKLKCNLSSAQQSQQHQHLGAAFADGNAQRLQTRSGAHRVNSQRSSADNLLETTAEPGMANMQTSGQEQTGLSFTSKSSPFGNPLADVHPQLMRTSPALSWGKPPQHSRQASDAQAVESDDGCEQAASSIGSEYEQHGISHHRTQSDSRGRFNTALSAAGSMGALSVDGGDALGHGTGAAPSGGASRALSSVLSTAELTGLFQEGDRADGSIVTHEGIVLHDAPLLGRRSPQPLPAPAGATAHHLAAHFCSNSATLHPFLA